MPVVLYKLDGSLPCRAVFMTLEIIKLKVQYEEVNSIEGETRKQEFVAKNPLQTIPIIEDGDFILADSHAIITYLVLKYGEGKSDVLYPSDSRIRATVDQRLYLDATVLFPRYRNIMTSMVKDKVSGPSVEQVDDVEEAYGFLEAYLQATCYLAADHLTLADVSCVATLSSMEMLVPINAKYTKLNEWFNRIKHREWYQKGNGAGLVMFSDFLNKILNKS